MDNTVEASAYELAALVMAMDLGTPKGIAAKQIARRLLGATDASPYPKKAAIVTNGTVRLLPLNEPVFLLRGQDVLAPLAVREWAKAAKLNGAVTAATQAEKQAALMEAWPARKLPDWPPSHAS